MGINLADDSSLDYLYIRAIQSNAHAALVTEDTSRFLRVACQLTDG